MSPLGQRSMDIPLPPPPPPPLLPPLRAFVVIVNVPETHPIVTTALTLVEFEDEDIDRATIESQEFTTPTAAENGAPLMLYSPPVIEMAVGAVMPVIDTEFDEYDWESSALVTAVKPKVFGTVSAGSVKAKSDNCAVENVQFPVLSITQVVKTL